jgi:hypothetical protein
MKLGFNRLSAKRKNHHHMCLSVDQQKDEKMRISLMDSNARGFNKWCETHDTGREDKSGTSAGDIATPAEDAERAVMTPPEQPHRPWLVAGVGTL